MLHIWYGLDWRENRRCLLEQICRRKDQKEKNQILLVPDQFSHQMERDLCRHGGPQISRYAEVLSFSRLADRVFTVGGGVADVAMDQGGRLLAMASAVEMVRFRLKKYASCGEKPEFLLQALQTVDECKAFCLNPDDLRDASERSEGEFAVKLEELALLHEGYEAACANGTVDAGGKLLLLLDRLSACDYDRDKTFWLEGFSDFNGIELQILEKLLADGRDVTVVLLCDDPMEGQYVFDSVRKTATQLMSIARRTQCGHEITCITPAERPAEPDYLRHHLFSGHRVSCPTAEQKIRLHAARDIHAEAQALAGEITRLVQSGCRYRDIGISVGQMELYRPVLQSVFSRYQIPAFYAGTDALSTKPVIQAILVALEAAATNMDSELIFSFLKSALSPVNRNACDKLENYAFIWGITGSGWQSEWTMHPEGFGKTITDSTIAELERLNAARETAIRPLAELKKNLHTAANTAEQVLALHKFLESVHFRGHMKQMAQKLQDDGDLQRAQEYAQLYQIVISALEQFYRVLGKTVRTAEEFFRLLKVLLSQYQVSTIPASLDCVHVGSVMSMRQNASPVMCVVGACDGMLPTAPETIGLFSEEDRKQLRDLGLNVAPGVPERLNRELNAIYNVMTGCDYLYVSTVAGNPAYLYNRLERLFPEAVCPEAPIPEVVTRNAAAAREYLAQLRCSEDHAELFGRISDCLPDGDDQLRDIFRKADSQPGSLSPTTVRELYGDTLQLSASKIDRFAKCSYGYFLEYGLRAKERKQAKFDAPLYGELVHYVLEHTCNQVKMEGGFHHIDTGRVVEIAESYIQAYADEKLPDLNDKPERFVFIYERNLQEVYEVVRNLCQELSQSEFEPTYFELEFSKNEDARMPAVSVVGRYMTGELAGKVDRVDLYRHGEEVYARVVDYKTGVKSFDYTDVLNGIGLQMLIYLFALEQGAKDAFGVEYKAGGVLYMPARFNVERAEKTDPEKLDQLRQNSFRRSGLLLENEDVLNAMEPDPDRFREGKKPSSGVFLPKLSDYMASEEEFERLHTFVEKSLADMVDRVASGDLTPNPYYRGADDNACRFCPYKTVCHEAAGLVKVRSRKARKRDQFWEEVEEKLNG